MNRTDQISIINERLGNQSARLDTLNDADVTSIYQTVVRDDAQRQERLDAARAQHGAVNAAIHGTLSDGRAWRCDEQKIDIDQLRADMIERLNGPSRVTADSVLRAKASLIDAARARCFPHLDAVGSNTGVEMAQSVSREIQSIHNLTNEQASAAWDAMVKEGK